MNAPSSASWLFVARTLAPMYAEYPSACANVEPSKSQPIAVVAWLQQVPASAPPRPGGSAGDDSRALQ